MNNNMNDKKLYCADCNTEFIWTVGMQEFLEGLRIDGKLDRKDSRTGEMIAGQVTPPKRCPDCRDLKKSRYPERR